MASASPMSLAAGGLSAVGSGAKAAGSILAGDTQASNYMGQAQNALDTAAQTSAYDRFTAQSLSDQAETGRIAAAQTDADLRMALSDKLANISAIRGATGTDPSSPTGAAIMARTSTVADMDREQRVGNIQAQTAQDVLASRYYQGAGRAAINIGNLEAGQYEANAQSAQTSGFLGAIGGLAGAVSPLFSFL